MPHLEILLEDYCLLKVGIYWGWFSLFSTSHWKLRKTVNFIIQHTLKGWSINRHFFLETRSLNFSENDSS